MSETRDVIEQIQSILRDGGPDADVRRKIKDLVMPPPKLDLDVINYYLGELIEHPMSHLHLYAVTAEVATCANCGVERERGQDVMLAIEIKSASGSDYARFCFNRDQECGAFRYLKSMRWLNVPERIG